MIRGDTECIRVSCKNTHGIDVPFVEGDKIYLTVKKSPNVEAKIFQKLVNQFTDGYALINLQHEDTANAQVGSYYYDVQLNTASGKVKTIVPPSRFVIEEEVTYE